ncbi:MAG: anti-sigma factor family protein [Armatimonadota bacterium]
MKCAKARRLIWTYVDGELNKCEVVKLESHIASCASCRKEYEEARSLSKLLICWEPVSPRVDFGVLSERIRQRESISRDVWLPVPRWAAVFLSILGVISGSILGFQTSHQAVVKAMPAEQIARAIGLMPHDDLLEAALLEGVQSGSNAGAYEGVPR